MSRRGFDKCNNQEGLNFPCRECHFLMICNLHLFTQSTEKDLAGCGMGGERESQSFIAGYALLLLYASWEMEKQQLAGQPLQSL